ncbi:hypothetical protein KKA00_13495 [bacterium]|nr:hypothetical protein [bacterium]MBU1653230.1 hypothetical protein [bacterium]MBU1880882.1 hypothetical protein [bacterium]
MSHALRTTLLLGTFWLLVFLAGFYVVHFRMKSTAEALAATDGKLAEELALNQDLVDNLATIQVELARSEREWAARQKFIPADHSAHDIYAYMDNILRGEKTTLNFDFLAGESRDSSGIQFADYTLSGEAKFIDLYSFLWYVEYLPRYFRINSVNMQEASSEKKDETVTDRWVRFKLEITSISNVREGFNDIPSEPENQSAVANYDPFNIPQKAKTSLPPNTRGLPNVFSSMIRALTPTQVYLIDQNGELRVLKLGDEVYLGKLVDIDANANRAIFELSKLQPPRRVPLEVNTGN